MSRWQEVPGTSGRSYAERFEQLAASGVDVHGEAACCAALLPAGARILDAGCGTGRVAIELSRRGYRCVGVDLDESMLAEARRVAPDLPWVHADLAELDLPTAGIPGGYDLVLAAGNVLPLLAAGTERAVVSRLAAALEPGALLVAGFGLDAAHLPLPSAPFGLAAYDGWCAEAGLALESRRATWDGRPYDGGGYAVSVHRRR